MRKYVNDMVGRCGGWVEKMGLGEGVGGQGVGGYTFLIYL